MLFRHDVHAIPRMKQWVTDHPPAMGPEFPETLADAGPAGADSGNLDGGASGVGWEARRAGIMTGDHPWSGARRRWRAGLDPVKYAAIERELEERERLRREREWSAASAASDSRPVDLEEEVRRGAAAELRRVAAEL